MRAQRGVPGLQSKPGMCGAMLSPLRPRAACPRSAQSRRPRAARTSPRPTVSTTTRSAHDAGELFGLRVVVLCVALCRCLTCVPDSLQASSSVPTQRPESTQGPEDIWTLPRLVDLVEAAFHVQHAAGLPEDIVEQFSRAANGLRERFGGMPRRSTPGRQQATTVRALYLCTACVWRHAQLLPAMFFNAILLCHWRMQSQANLSLCWSLVLAADGQTGPTLEALVILRPLFEAAKIEVLLAFADLSPTAGFFHMSWARRGRKFCKHYCNGRSIFQRAFLSFFRMF